MLIFLTILSMATPAVSQEDRYRQEIKLSIIPVVGLDGKHTDEWGVAPSVPFFVTRRYAQRGDKVSKRRKLLSGVFENTVVNILAPKGCGIEECTINYVSQYGELFDRGEPMITFHTNQVRALMEEATILPYGFSNVINCYPGGRLNNYAYLGEWQKHPREPYHEATK